MKLKVFFVALVMGLFGSSAFAQFFPGQAYVTVLPGRVSVQVYNPYYEPIVCSGQVFGRTYYGQVYNTFFAQQFMPAGSYRFAYVAASPYNRFVGGWANIQCRFARGW